MDPLWVFLDETLEELDFRKTQIVLLHHNKERQYVFEKISDDITLIEKYIPFLINQTNKMFFARKKCSRYLGEKYTGSVFLHENIAGVFSSIDNPLFNEAVAVMWLIAFNLCKKNISMRERFFWDEFLKEANFVNSKIIEGNPFILDFSRELSDKGIHQKMTSIEESGIFLS